METKFAIDQAKYIHGVLKLALTAYEIDFTKCKSLAKQLFPEIDTDLLEMMSPDDSELPTVIIDVVDEDKEGPSQVGDDNASEIHDQLLIYFLFC